jgi:AraC-like DNA-binding protein
MEKEKKATHEPLTAFPPTGELSGHIKELMRKGDIAALRDLLFTLSEKWPLETMDASSFAFFRKKLLTGCGRAAQVAIDEGVPYQEANALSDVYFANFESAMDLARIRDESFAMLIETTRLIAYYKYPKYSKHVRTMLNFIQTHFTEKLTLDDIGSNAGLSPNYATLLFKKETGRRLKDEIKKTRIDRAIELLTTTSLSVTEIAKQTGFSQTNHLSRVLKSMTGFTPTEYRNKKTRKTDTGRER